MSSPPQHTRIEPFSMEPQKAPCRGIEWVAGVSYDCWESREGGMLNFLHER